MGGLDLAPAILDRAGEGALGVAEEFALQKFLGKARATDRDQGFVGQVALLMDDAGQGAFAGAAFAKRRMEAGVRAAFSRHFHDFLHARGGKIQEQFGALGLGLLDLAFEALDVLAHLIEALHAGHDAVELFAGEGFFQEIQRAAAHGFDGSVDGALGGENHHRQIGIVRRSCGSKSRPFSAPRLTSSSAASKSFSLRLARAASPEAAG